MSDSFAGGGARRRWWPPVTDRHVGVRAAALGYGCGVSAPWDLIVVGAGPAGAATALGALRDDPGLSVLLLDRADFPRDKACGDGIAPHVMDQLAGVGLSDLLDDRSPVHRLRLHAGSHWTEAAMRRPVCVVPRTVFDARLVDAAVAAGACLVRHRVRQVDVDPHGVTVDGRFRGRVLVGADGAQSLVRAQAGVSPPRRVALAIRGYAAPLPGHERSQVIAFGGGPQPSYAWSFDTGDGVANIGYGELLPRSGAGPSRSSMLARLEQLLPGATAAAERWRGHHLPLSQWSWHPPVGRVLLAGDAAGLVNPMTGEGIYYAVATGMLAGRSAAASLERTGGASSGSSAGARHRQALRGLLARHLRHTAVAAQLASRPAVLGAALDAATRSRAIFDDMVELGLGDGFLNLRAIAGLARALPQAWLSRSAGIA